VTLPLAGAAATFSAVVRSARPVGDEQQAGLEFVDPPIRATAALALALFRTGITPRIVPGTPAGDRSGTLEPSARL
jgi:hypothetical protein